MTESEKILYLNDHVAYVLKMLRHAHARINRGPHSLDWNMALDAFGGYARTLYYFLTNHQDSNSVKARDFAPQSRASGENMFAALNGHILHLGKNRSSDQEEKIQLQDANRMWEWIEEHFHKFVDQLSEPYRSKWNGDNADPAKATAIALTVTPKSGSSHMISTFVHVGSNPNIQWKGFKKEGE